MLINYFFLYLMVNEDQLTGVKQCSHSEKVKEKN